MEPNDAQKYYNWQFSYWEKSKHRNWMTEQIVLNQPVK